MAKTKPLQDIAAQTDNVMKLLIDLGGKLGYTDRLGRKLLYIRLQQSHYETRDKIITEMDKLDQTISKLEERIKSWDGSPKLRDIFKKKADLAKAREAAKQKLVLVKADAKAVHDSFSEVQNS